MQTVDKAFELLEFFSERRTQFGLSELARLASFDKATTRRLLLALAKHGLVEQDPDDKRYRLGPGVLRLARIRESSMPLATIATPLLRRLVDGCGETAHLTVLAGKRLSTVAVAASERSNRVNMDIGEVLPLHATASGLVILAHAGPALLESLDPENLQAYTAGTCTSRSELMTLVASARNDGYAVNDGWYESDACSIAAPYFDQYGDVRGSIAVAAPSSRFGAAEQAAMQVLVVSAANELTTRIGGAHRAVAG